MECIVIILPYLPGDYIYQNGPLFFMLTGFIFNKVVGNLTLNELIHRLFFNEFLYLFPEFPWDTELQGKSVGWLMCGAAFCWGLFLIGPGLKSQII